MSNSILMSKIFKGGKLKERSLETIPEINNGNTRSRGNFLIIKKINFNNRGEASSNEKVKYKSVTNEAESDGKKEKKPILLSSIRTNKFSSSSSSNKYLSGKEYSGQNKSESKDKEIISHRVKKKKAEVVLPLINTGLSIVIDKTGKGDSSAMIASLDLDEKTIKDKKARTMKNDKKDKIEEEYKTEKAETGKETSATPKKRYKSTSKYSSFNSKKSKFESFANREKEKEEFNDRYSSVRKSFQDKKLHMFNKAEKLFYYIILPGNSSYLVKNCMTHRVNWRECQSQVSTLFNFKWQQNNVGLDFGSLSKVSSIKQVVNHFENHPVISNKCNLFINLTKYCESRGLEVFNYIPFTVIFQYDSAGYSTQMDNLGSLYNNIREYIPGSVSSGSSSPKGGPKVKKYNTMFSLLGSGNEKIGSKTSVNVHPNHYDGKNFWIIKATNLNRGRCIKMADSFQKVQKLVKKFYEGITTEYTNEDEELLLSPNLMSEDEKKKMMMNKYRTNSVIVQKYIEKPLLYRGRKFDIRIWTIITHKLEVYVFKEGHLKTSSVPYDVSLTNSYVHITNYSIQKYSDNFSKFEDGNEVSFADFQNFLNDEYSSKGIDVRRDILSKIKEIIEITSRAVYTKINPNNRKNCFEIFGYDFIIDIDFNVFLLEVNTNPGLEESSPLIKMLVPRMLDDAMRLTIDDLYETKYCFFGEEVEKTSTYYSPFLVEGYPDSENMWELVCDLNEKEAKVEEKKKKKKRK